MKNRHNINLKFSTIMKRVLFSMVLLMAVSFSFAQMKNVKEQEENMYSSSSDTTEELCSSSTPDACGDGSTAFPQKARRTYQRKS